MSDAASFVQVWSTVWDGPNSNAERYMEVLHEGCRLVNPISEGTREDLPEIFQSFLALMPDIRVQPMRWAQTDDGVLIEWCNRGTLRGKPFELWGADRFVLRDGKAIEGYSYFDPRPLLGEAS